MKRVFLSILVAFAITIASLASVFAAANTIDVKGLITVNNKVINGASVVVVCNSQNLVTTTNVQGSYTVHFDAIDCPVGSKATVVATQNKLGGVNTGLITSSSPTTVNINIVNATVPEFGIIAGIVAVIAGGIAYLVIRIRHHNK